ncbi:MAG: methyltransferase family protein [Promethearchaeota archaeon]
MEYPYLLLWKSVDFIIINWIIDISLFSLIHIILGALIFSISFYQCIYIVKLNNQAHEAKNHPKILLDQGYYAKVRHPMTSRFILIILAFFFMLGSLLVFPLILLFTLIFFLIALNEEKKILFPIFGQEYQEYMNKVNYRFFTIKTKMILILLFSFMIFGVFFSEI